MPEGRHRARSQGARGPGGERPHCLRRHRRAGEGGAPGLTKTRREVFLQQAHSAAGRSPLYDALWRRLADEPLVDELVDGYEWDTPLRLVAGLHFLVLSGRIAWEEVDQLLVEQRDFLRRFVAERRVQTNEVQRSWVLLPCFLEVARRSRAESLDVIELGASAGLNLVWDRYRYVYERGAWGAAESPLELRGDERRPVAAELLAERPRVVHRVGVDIAPVDVTTPEGALLLKSFVWADQTWRLELLDRAIAALREDPPRLIRGDLVEELPPLLARRRRDSLTVVFETAVLGYVSADTRATVRGTLSDAAADGPLAFVSTAQPADREHTYWGMYVTLWPDGRRELVAHVDFHGRWLEWLA